MPDYDKLLQTGLPGALEDAYSSINGAFDQPEQLLQADVRAFEELPCCIFAYFNREDVFYVNKTGRSILGIRYPLTEAKVPKAPPIFWLEDDSSFLNADQFVLSRRQALANARELVTLSWGKTWLDGIKFPILSVTGQPMAILFAGAELAPSQQIRRVADHYQLTQTGTGEN